MAKNEDIVEELDRRAYRRKRRIRNQAISYIALAVILIGLVIGCVIGVGKVMKILNEKKLSEDLQKQLEELTQNEEEPATVEAPDDQMEPVGETDYLDEIVNNCIAEMPLEDKVAGLFIITPEALTDTDIVVRAGDTTKEKLTAHTIGGLIYSSQNIKDSEQLMEMLKNTKNWSRYPIFLGIEEEGGEVSRVAQAGLADNVGPMAEIGSSGDAAIAKEAGTAIGSYLSGYGFNMDFAPVADVAVEENALIGERSFGSDVNLVSPMVAAAVEGLQESGVSACLKHFPGLGNTTEDPHNGMAVTEKTMDDFAVTDFPVYQAGIGAGVDFIMVSHLSAPNALGDNTPASLSPVMITDTLKGQFGYQGIVLTDAMDMAAITEYYTSGEAAVKALLAGADMILMPENFLEAYQGVLDAVNDGTLSEERIDESLRRIYRVRYKDRVE